MSAFSVEKIAQNMPGGMLIYKATKSAEILFASEGIVKLFECDSVDDFMKFTGGSFNNVVYPEDIETIDRIINAQVEVAQGFDFVVYRIMTKNGQIKNIEDWGHLVFDELFGNLYYVYVHDIGFKNQLSAIGVDDSGGFEAAGHMTDELTGLFNGRGFRAKAGDKIDKMFKNHQETSCIYFNVRNFHTYNETYGYAGGDRMLKSIARILQDTFPNGLVSRFGEDHFVVITGQSDLEEKIMRMSNRINNIRRGAVVEMKAGVYRIQDKNMDLSLICDYAKLACDSIKTEYGATVQFYDNKVNQKALMQDYVMKNFDDAIAQGRLKVYFQPVINVSTGEVASYEALTRWQTDDQGTLTPSNFIYALEEQHMIHKLDSYVIRKVCEELGKRKKAGKKLIPVSLNISRLDFELTDIVSIIEDSVKSNNIPNDLLRFEITESLLAIDMDAMKLESDRLRKHGFKVWMDAFGSGYSSLKVIREFTLDGVKIDMDMIRSFDDKRTNIILSSIISMARKLGIPILSKGVETKEQLEFLKGTGCDLAQGYLFGHPEPAERI